MRANKNEETSTLRLWLALGGWLAIVAAIITCADRGRAPRLFALASHVPLGVKAGHFILIGILAWLLNRALLGRRVPIALWQIQLGGLIISLLMTIEETSQIWLATRHFDLKDLAANYAGIACAGWLTRAKPAKATS